MLSYRASLRGPTRGRGAELVAHAVYAVRMTPDERRERHRQAQARYAATEKGKAKREAWRVEDVRTGGAANRQYRYAMGLADARSETFLAGYGYEVNDLHALFGAALRRGLRDA